MNNVGTFSNLDDIIEYDARRYDGWTLTDIMAALGGETLGLLKRGSLAALIARREWGGMLNAASKILPTFKQPSLFRSVVNLDYSDARRHMKLWHYWERIERMLRDRERSCKERGVPFVVPGYRRCLEMAGLIGRREPPPYDPPPRPVEREPLSDEVEALQQMIEELEKQNRLEREDKTRTLVELDLLRDELRELQFDRQRSDEQPSTDIMGRFAGWWRRRPKPVPTPRSERPCDIEVRIGNCLDLIEQEANVYHAIVTDAPYAISLHGKEWDSTDISFSSELWQRFMQVLRPGGYVAFFAASRLYHRAATAAEDAGFRVLPFLAWRFREGLPKPINLSELFDRDNLNERAVIGQRQGSGFTRANVDQGQQNRSHVVFDVHARHISDEAQQWRGYFYGTNALKPTLEPILLVQKPITTERMIDNIREWGTGALNIGALNDQYGYWPSTVFTHRKTNKTEHLTDHPSVKPVFLMEDLCTLVCPAGGRILDPFCGTGTTGVAAAKRGFDCVLIEQDARMRLMIEDRLRRLA